MSTRARPSIARRTAVARGLVPAPSVVRCERATVPDSLAVRSFTRQVALATNGACLRYSQRLSLLSLAHGAGINRFDANLIIAAIEHRAGHSRQYPAPAQPSRRTILPTVCAAGLAQLAILFSAWLALMH